ncbi:hypothetical protein QM334_33715, partial [Burkholderia cenocepacia]|nr:hypothetical protein [Burkholderia cenocepacia]
MNPLHALPASASATARRTRVRWLVLAVLFAVTTINYADRAAIAIAGPALARDRDGRTIRVVDRRDREQDGQHEPAHAGAPGRCRRGRRQRVKRIHDSSPPKGGRCRRAARASVRA